MDGEILEQLFDSKIIRVLKVFLGNPSKQFYLREIARLCGLAPATTFRILARLQKLDLISMANLKTSKLYSLEDNKSTKYLQSIIDVKQDIPAIFVQNIKSMSGLSSIILHGKKTDNKANLLLIGKDIDSTVINSMVAHVKEKYEYTLSCLTLAPEQYAQMSSMGLFSGEKKVLLEK